jgi:hypothetical protein
LFASEWQNKCHFKITTVITPEENNNLHKVPITNHEPPDLDNAPLDATNNELGNQHITNDNQINDRILKETIADIPNPTI